ncbi:P-loop containing nucleoside triphosphate hydrolase protein [Massariosphaeria phaeospora]|uniref:P-loop containing nucleoside triphosphate hydrolase protein n=1 Tax=Massariosphaeria phaeospora TaxID=100035 RepID=A0A7C8MPH4_9PLEO|nr:P-loop containing nucleoside triphosphate hydrolase protein [Massariosphaeria phaeospora]
MGPPDGTSAFSKAARKILKRKNKENKTEPTTDSASTAEKERSPSSANTETITAPNKPSRAEVIAQAAKDALLKAYKDPSRDLNSDSIELNASCLFDSEWEKSDHLSPSQSEWIRQKKDHGQTNRYIDQVMAMVGLEEIKAHFLLAKAYIEAARRRDGDIKKQTSEEKPDGLDRDLHKAILNLVLLGSMGTGKQTVAMLYEGFIQQMRVGSNSADEKAEVVKRPIVQYKDAKASDVKAILAKSRETSPDPIVIVCCHEKQTVHSISASTEGRRRFPTVLHFNDYTDAELLQILNKFLNRRKMAIEGENSEFCVRVLVKRAARTRGSSTYSNVHGLEYELDKVCRRQAERLKQEWGVWLQKQDELVKAVAEINDTDGDSIATKYANSPDVHGNESGATEPYSNKDVEEDCSFIQPIADLEQHESKMPRNFVLVQEDVFGPAPRDIRETSAAYKELSRMIGLRGVKDAVDELFSRAQTNYYRELEGLEPLRANLNCIFLGPPGTGKTTVASLYARIVADAGLLSTNEVIFKNPMNFLSKGISGSETNTKKALDLAEGKVLVLDDAHTLYISSGSGSNVTDKHRIGVVDTLVANVSSKPGQDRCIILVGYEEPMRKLFRAMNPGLRKIFPLEDAYIFQDFNAEELGRIFDQKVGEEQLEVTAEAKQVAERVLDRLKIAPNFGNGSEIDNLLGRAKVAFRKSLLQSPNGSSALTAVRLQPQHFDPDYDRDSQASQNCRELFKDFVGFEKIIDFFQHYQLLAVGMRKRNLDPRPYIPWAFVFEGPSGTGKTSTARKVGRLYYDMNLLATDEVITCSVSDLVGEYLGQTGPKVVRQLERALGKVLFVDEAYRLAPKSGNGRFQDEAVGELVDAMTNPRYARNMILIFAGYTAEMDSLMHTNPGLRSRFADHIVFPAMRPSHCWSYFKQRVGRLEIKVVDDVDDVEREKRAKLLRLFKKLGATKSWANGRDVETLANAAIELVFRKQAVEDDVTSRLTISIDEVIKVLQGMFRQRLKEQRKHRGGKDSESED